MSIPTGHSAFLHQLELNVRADLIQAETSQPEEEAVRVPIDEWLIDPVDAQRYEVGLRNRLGAVEAMEDGSGPGGSGRPVTYVADGASGDDRTATTSPRLTRAHSGPQSYSAPFNIPGYR